MILGDHTYIRNKYANKKNIVPAIRGVIVWGGRVIIYKKKTINKSNKCVL
jgi:hypothetical protein